MAKYYAGIGSRSTPAHIQTVMTALARKLEQDGWTLRTGDAKGADTAFARGTRDAQIYTIQSLSKISSEMLEICRNDFLSLHPNVRAAMAKPWAQQYLMRDSLQVRGYHPKDKHSSFVVCWTPNGELSGGTAQAMRVAMKLSIPVFNLGNPADLEKILKYLNN